MRSIDWLQQEGDKLLLCGSISEANRWIRRNNRVNQIIVQGVTACTISNLAKNIVEKAVAFDLSEEIREVKVIDNTMAARIVLEILQDQVVIAQCEANGITPIPKTSIDSVLALKVVQAFHKLRLGEEKENVDFTEADRERDKESGNRFKDRKPLLDILLKKYEETLTASAYYDRCTILQEALKLLERSESDKETIYGIYRSEYSRYQMACLLPWERTYLENQFLNKIEELSSGQKLTMLDMRVPDEEKSVRYEFVKAYGAANEIRHIADEIRERKIPYGDVTVLYSSQEHASFIQTVFGEMGIPYCMLSGRAALDNDYVDLLYRLLDWMRAGGYGDIEIFLKRFDCFKLYKTEEGEQGEKIYRSLLPDAVRDLREIHRELSGQEKVTVFDLLKNLEDFFTNKPYNRSISRNLMWKAAKECWNSIYDRYEGAATVSFSEAVVFLKEELERTSIADAERQDAISVMRIGRPHVLEREHNYIVGLSDYHFRDTLLDSAILPDEQLQEWIKVGDDPATDEGKDYVELELDAEKRKQEHLTDTLNTLSDGRLILSYSSYDSINQKEISSSLYFQDIRAEKQTEKEIEVGYPILPYNYVDSADLFTVSAKEQEKKPGDSRIPVLSSSALATMLLCPRMYYYEKILHIPREEEKERDTGTWLDPLAKGTLVHGILEEYISREIKGKEEVEAQIDQNTFGAVFEANIESVKEQVPCESPAVFEREKQSYREALEQYLSELHREFSKKEESWKVYECEMKIGMDENYRHCLDDEYRETYSYGEDEKLIVSYHGELDRVDFHTDADGKTHFRIIDYKTGKQESHQKKLDNDKWPQHIIYARLLEAKYENSIVDEFIYVFPFEEAEKRTIIYKRENLKEMTANVKGEIIRILGERDYGILHILQDGKKAKEHQKVCARCSYQDMCKERIGNKI